MFFIQKAPYKYNKRIKFIYDPSQRCAKTTRQTSGHSLLRDVIPLTFAVIAAYVT